MKEFFLKVYKSSKEDYFKRLEELLKNGKKKFVITANPETFKRAAEDQTLKNALVDEANDVIPDGIAIVKAAKHFDIDIKERIAGIDVAEELLRLANKEKKSVYFFGAKKEVLNSLIAKVEEKYSNLVIAGCTDGYVKDKNEVFEKIAKVKPDICLVALGIPLQEHLIIENLDKFKKGIFVGVGGSFDVLSGTKKRAPKIFIKLNLEWLYRIIKEPSRLKRFWNNNVKFMFDIYREKK